MSLTTKWLCIACERAEDLPAYLEREGSQRAHGLCDGCFLLRAHLTAHETLRREENGVWIVCALPGTELASGTVNPAAVGKALSVALRDLSDANPASGYLEEHQQAADDLGLHSTKADVRSLLQLLDYYAPPMHRVGYHHGDGAWLGFWEVRNVG